MTGSKLALLGLKLFALVLAIMAAIATDLVLRFLTGTGVSALGVLVMVFFYETMRFLREDQEQSGDGSGGKVEGQ